MKLFEDPIEPDNNLLPYDGEVNYFGRIFKPKDADSYLQQLLETLDWQHDQAVIFGKHVTTKRKVAWYGDHAFEYTYSGILKRALPWPALLLDIKNKVEGHSKTSFNSCLCNLYNDGSEGMAWHSDGEKDLEKHGTIASVTFGAERKFGFKHKRDKTSIYMQLEHGSLLTMKGETQDHWLHRLPPTVKVQAPRVNLTFRTIKNQ